MENYLKGRASQHGELRRGDRASASAHNVCPGDRAFAGTHGVYQGARAFADTPEVGQHENSEGGATAFVENNEKKKSSEESDQLKSATIVLPTLAVVGADAGLQCGDWMAQLRPLMGDLATTALDWWDSVVQEVNTKYQVWLAASPLERLNAMHPEEKIYNTSVARQRMDLRASALLMAALPQSLKEELVASRHLTSGHILYRILQTYQPGGAMERSTTLAELTGLKPAKEAREAVDKLRKWKRHKQRAQELQVTLPDTSLLVKSLSTLVNQILGACPQANFRVNVYRMASRVEICNQAW